MEIKPIEWRIVEEGIYWMKRGDAESILNNYSVEELKEMETNLYKLWSRVKKITEMKELLESMKQNKLPDWSTDEEGGEEE
jgi:signal transduction histidine kinase